MVNTLEALMSAPPSVETGQKILDWADEIDNAVLRGDLMIGILSLKTVEKVPGALRRAAECGRAEAWLKLAEWHEHPPIDKPDTQRADEALNHAVTHHAPGAELALVRLRWFRRREQASAAEKLQAFQLMQARVQENDTDDEALHLLALLTCAGFGTEANPTAAFELQQRAARQGNSDAHFELYVQLSTGLGVPVDEQAALAHNEQAARGGHSRAAYNMGAFLATGRYGKKDMAEAAGWYQRACDLGNGRACASLAAMYALGDGVPADRVRARGLFDVAEEDGFDPAGIKAAIGWEETDER